MSRLMPLLTAVLVLAGFAAFFVSFLFAPLAVLGVTYIAMIAAGRARAAKKRRHPAGASVGDTKPGSSAT